MGQTPPFPPIYDTKNGHDIHILFAYIVVPNIFNDVKSFRRSLTEIITLEIFQMKVRSKGSKGETNKDKSFERGQISKRKLSFERIKILL